MNDAAEDHDGLGGESADAEAWLDSIDPLTAAVETVPQEVRDVGQAVEALHRAQAEVDAAVARARDAGASWNALALPHGARRRAGLTAMLLPAWVPYPTGWWSGALPARAGASAR